MIIAICMTIRIAVVRRSRSARLAELTNPAEPGQDKPGQTRLAQLAKRQAEAPGSFEMLLASRD